MTMHWADLGAASLRWELTGTGDDVLVLVHEMGGTLESWDQVLPQVTAGRRVLRYDFRGAGLSEKARGALTFPDMAADLHALLEVAGITGRVALAGVAVGAGVALTFAGRNPDRTTAVIAMAPATGIPADRQEAVLRLADAVEREGMRAIQAASFLNSYPPEVRFDADQFRAFSARWLANDPHSYATIYRMLAHADMDADIAAITAPSLVVAGTHDRLRPPAAVQPVADRLGTRVEVLETGHFMAVQTPGLVATVINGFLA